MAQALTLQELDEAVAGGGVAIRAVRRLQPAGGPGTKVFPPTYGVADAAPHQYAIELRRPGNGQPEVPTVLLDAVQSQANRLEDALLRAWRRHQLRLPVVTVDFSEHGDLRDVGDDGEITALDAPHRLADAILRDSVAADGKPFRLTAEGLAFTSSRVNHATALYRLCPTALIFGVWDSTGPKGGQGTKFARALVSEIVGWHVARGSKTSSRIDPLQVQNISKQFPIYEGTDGLWTLDEKRARREKDKPLVLKTGRASEVNHGNMKPSIDERAGGVTIDFAEQTVVLSLAALRRLGFREDCTGKPLAAAARAQAEQAGRTVLAALALVAVVLQQQADHDLRSRCLLIPEGPLVFDVLHRDGQAPHTFSLDETQALALLDGALPSAAQHGMGWDNAPGDPVLRLRPMPKLVDLVRRSREAAATSTAAEA